MAGNKEIKTDSDELPGCFPFTPAPEDYPVPEHSPSLAATEPASSANSDIILSSLIPPSNSMSDHSHSTIKLVTDPLDDNNFTTWRFKMINALGYQMLDDYVLVEDQ